MADPRRRPSDPAFSAPRSRGSDRSPPLGILAAWSCGVDREGCEWPAALASLEGDVVAARRGSACERKSEGEPGAAVGRLSPDPPAVGFYDSPGDVEAQP